MHLSIHPVPPQIVFPPFGVSVEGKCQHPCARLSLFCRSAPPRGRPQPGSRREAFLYPADLEFAISFLDPKLLQTCQSVACRAATQLERGTADVGIDMNRMRTPNLEDEHTRAPISQAPCFVVQQGSRLPRHCLIHCRHAYSIAKGSTAR
jgi:hypothetical protein